MVQVIVEPLAAQLTELVDADLVRRVPEPEPEYAFKHALTQESAYAQMLVRRVRELHRLVAEAYEQLYAAQLNEHAAFLAYHYGEAGDDERYAHYALLAGESAERVFANHEACTYYWQARQALARLPDTVENRRHVVDALTHYVDLAWTTGQTTEHFEQLDEAEQLARSLPGIKAEPSHPDRLRLARVQELRGTNHWSRNEVPEALALFRQVLSEVPPGPDTMELRILPASLIGQVLALTGHVSEALPLLQEAAAGLENQPLRWELYATTAELALCLVQRGQVGEGLATLEQFLQRPGVQENLSGLSSFQLVSSLVYWAADEPDKLLEQARAGLETARKGNDPVFIYLGLGMQALGESLAGQHARAERLIAEAQALRRQLDIPFQEQRILAVQAEVARNAGQSERAAALAEQAIGVARAASDLVAEGALQRTWGQALAATGTAPAAEIESHFAESVRLLQEGELVVEVARTEVAQGIFDRDHGAAAAARAHWQRAAAQFEASGLARELDETRRLIQSLPQA